MYYNIHIEMLIDISWSSNNYIIIYDNNLKLSYPCSVIEYLFISNPHELHIIEKEILYKEICLSIYLKGYPNKDDNIFNWLKSNMDSRESIHESTVSRFEYIESTINLLDRHILCEKFRCDMIETIILYLILYSIFTLIVCVLPSKTNRYKNMKNLESTKISNLMFPELHSSVYDIPPD